MTPELSTGELEALLTVLGVIILGSGWILGIKVKRHFNMLGRRAQEKADRELTSRPTPLPPPNEIWQWPKRSHGAPGAWGGPTEVLEDFLWRLQHTGRHEILRNASIKINGIDLTRRVKRVRVMR